MWEGWASPILLFHHETLCEGVLVTDQVGHGGGHASLGELWELSVLNSSECRFPHVQQGRGCRGLSFTSLGDSEAEGRVHPSWAGACAACGPPGRTVAPPESPSWGVMSTGSSLFCQGRWRRHPAPRGPTAEQSRAMWHPKPWAVYCLVSLGLRGFCP